MIQTILCGRTMGTNRVLKHMKLMSQLQITKNKNQKQMETLLQKEDIFQGMK